MQQNVPVADRRFADAESIAHAVNIGTAHLKAHAGYSGFGNSINLTIAGNASNGSNSKIRQPGVNNLQPGKGVGRFGKQFKVHKFRSMRQDAEAKTGPVLAGENDPRITKFGHFMRATRLDELPQLINVLKGEMSIVGPRPERPFFVEQFIKEKPEYAYRHNVKPGITGLAQIAGKYNTTAYDKLVYDLIYIQNVSVMYDLTLMLQTLKVLITKESTEGVK